MRQYKNILFSVLFLVSGINLFSQGYNNRWINLSQKYYKIKIPKDGIYRLDSATLANAGIPISTINPQNIQLVQKGKEIYPYIFGEADSIFNTNDYILFYAEKNSSKDDSLLYDNVPILTNPYYSIINDSATVFLTWNNSTTNKRLTLNTDTTYSQFTPAPYYYKEAYTPQAVYGLTTILKPDYYNLGPLNALNQSDPRYKLGEGQVYDYNIGQTVVSSFSIPTASVYTLSPYPFAYFTICVSGANNILTVLQDHIIQTDYIGNLSNPLPLTAIDSFPAYTTRKYTYTVNPSNFGASTTTIRLTNLPNPNPDNIDNIINLNYISAFYPKQFNLLDSAEEKIYLPDDNTGGQTKSKLVITNLRGSSPVMIDVMNHRLLTVTASGSNFLVLVPNSGGSKYCYVSSNIIPVSRIIPVNRTSTPGSFVNYFPSGVGVQDSVYVIVSHPKLMYAAGVHGVNDYKNWRASGSMGGNFNVIAASAEDLADQFGYGVDNNPLAIRNFCRYLIDTAFASSKKAPSNLFLMGKSIHPQDVLMGAGLGPSAVYADKCLVPTWGNPASDGLITQGLPGSLNLEPAIPTGRLAAQSDADVLAYLSKAELHEQQHQPQIGDSLWKKRAIHFVGGNTFGDQHAFESYMNGFKSIYEDTLMGGNVFTFRKISSAPVSVTTNDSVRQLINSGVSLITFFGHGSQTGFDENIDDPQNYTNSPRFPFILANSCFTGDIHSGDQLSHSELFTLAPNNHGCIGYVATVTEGIANYLAFYSQEMYKQFCYKNYGQSYGTSIKNTVRKLIQDMPLYANDTILILTSLEMTLHGDPALKPYSFSLPDYTLTNPDVIFNTTKYPTDSIGISVIMTNLGRAKKDSFSVLIQRNFPNGDISKWYKRVNAPFYKDTLSFFIPLDYYRAVGLNNFSVTLDYGDFIKELDENNNSTIGSVSLFIRGADIEPVWPYKYAIVPNLVNVILKASTADPFAPMTTYRFQVDTNDSFLSMLVNTTVNAPGGVVSLPVTLYGGDSIVYYWRVAKDTVVAPNWKESSFQVLTGKYGWGQSHFNQFKNDNYQYVRYNKAKREFDFYNTVKTIKVNDIVSYGLYVNLTDVQFFYNGNQERLWSCAPDGWSIALFDSITGNLKQSDTLNRAPALNSGNPTWYGTNGDCICDYTTRSVFDFGNYNKCDTPGVITNDYRPNLVSFINNIPVGTPVLAYSVKLDVLSFPVNAAMKTAFHSIGSSQIDNLTDTTVLIIFGKKTAGSSAGQAHEVLSSNHAEMITLFDSIKPHFDNGFITSEIIGPCKYSDTAWKSLHWCFKNSPGDIIPGDTILVQVIGIDSAGHKTPVANFTKDSLDVLDLSHYANGKRFPYLQLIAYESDKINTTPPQLKRWQVIFDQAPECAIHPPAGYSLLKNNLAEGETFEVRVPIKNISDFKFDDSLLVTYNLQDANRVSHILPYKLKRKPFLPDSVFMDTVRINTLGFAGANVLWIDVNPPAHPKYQPEQFHFNNIAEIAFTVNKDKINPMLDVTFDGVHILNGDIVSAKPNIYVSLKDENKFLALNDTGNFMVYVLKPGASSETRLYFSNTLQFVPAQLPNNSCKINYHPILTQDGLHTFHIRSTDRSGNVSGQYDYRIQFDVVNKPSITEVLNYPNPFSTSTKFVFTITGSEVPETLKIQILTITGRVVKEITREELGFLHIGPNITDYAWDGKDQFGDQLANGVYLYRVQTRLNGNEIDHLNTSADSYFKKGYGKMLLMR